MILESLSGVLTRTRRSNRCSIEIYWGTCRTQRSNVVYLLGLGGQIVVL